MNPFRYALAMTLLIPATGHAQLLSEQVQDNSRICTYYGSDTTPDGQTLPRTFNVGIGQNCPASAPYRDPNAPVPPNAMLIGERTTSVSRICLYEEGGLQYSLSVDIGLRCAATPALLTRRSQNPLDDTDR